MTKTLSLALLLSAATLALPVAAQDVDDLPETVREDLAGQQEGEPMGMDAMAAAGMPMEMTAEEVTGHFVTAAAHSGLFEIQSSRLALERSEDDEVRRFAEDMIRQHEKMNADLARAAAAPLPTELGAAQALVVAGLMGKRGDEFDRAYLAGQIHGHGVTAADYEAMIAMGEDGDVKAHAEQGLPAIKDHLARAEALKARLPAM